LIGHRLGVGHDRLEDLDAITALPVLHLKMELLVIELVDLLLELVHVAPQLTVRLHQSLYKLHRLLEAVGQGRRIQSVKQIHSGLLGLHWLLHRLGVFRSSSLILSFFTLYFTLRLN
jgi:hypothetical protein